MQRPDSQDFSGLKPKPPAGMRHPMDQPDGPPPAGTRREVFGLTEGDVVISFPENLSAESYGDLEAYFSLFLRKAKRRAELVERYKDPAYLERREAELRRRAERSEGSDED